MLEIGRDGQCRVYQNDVDFWPKLGNVAMTRCYLGAFVAFHNTHLHFSASLYHAPQSHYGRLFHL